VSSRYPHWPRMMRRPTAAAYCDLSVADFEREVVGGRLPAPIKLGREDHWSLDQLDAALDTMLGVGGKRDWRKDQPGLNAAA
jgi:hypothetical protein